jgi:hypothetical protein
VGTARCRRERVAVCPNTNRSTITVCSEISLRYRWDRTEARDLDEKDRLTEVIDERVREAVRTWGAEAEWDPVLGEE